MIVKGDPSFLCKGKMRDRGDVSSRWNDSDKQKSHYRDHFRWRKVSTTLIPSEPPTIISITCLSLGRFLEDKSMSPKDATFTKNEKKKKKCMRPKILGRNIVGYIPDSNLRKFRPPNKCGTHPISTLKTWKIHGQLPNFGTQNFMVEYNCMYPWQQPTKMSTPSYMWNPFHFNPSDFENSRTAD